MSAGTAGAAWWRWRFRRGIGRTSSATIYHEHNAQRTVRYALGLFDNARIWRCSSLADDPATALGLVQAGIVAELEETTPSNAHSRTPQR